MRRFSQQLICYFLVAAFVFALFAFPVSAADHQEGVVLSRIEAVNEDGSRIETLLIEYGNERASGVKTGRVTRDYYNDLNEHVWRVSLTGTFSYNGVSATCTNAYTTTTFYKTGWSVQAENTTHSGNTAYCTVVIAQTVLGVAIPFTTVSLSLSCDKNGNLS